MNALFVLKVWYLSLSRNIIVWRKKNVLYVFKWATWWENLFMPYANNKGADQPAHSHSLISTFLVYCLDSIIPLVCISEILSLCLVSVTAQTSLSLPWSQTRKTGLLMTRLRLWYLSGNNIYGSQFQSLHLTFYEFWFMSAFCTCSEMGTFISCKSCRVRN